MKYIIAVILVCFISKNIDAQNQLLNMVNLKTGKTIKVNVGDKMTIQYHGYSSQLAFVRDEVTGADDSCIYLGRTYENISEKLSNRLQKNGRGYMHKIRYSDVVQFRRESVGRNLLKTAVFGLPAAFGSYYLISEYLKSYANVSPFYQFLTVTGIGIVTLALPKIILPENLKYKVDNQWTFVLVNKFVP